MNQRLIAVAITLAPLFFLAAPALAWTGPGSSPPAGNTAPPINSSSISQSKAGPLFVGTGVSSSTAGLDVTGIAAVDSLLVGGNTTLGASSYINFGPSVGNSGYGIWDNGGTLMFRNSVDASWRSLQKIIFDYGSTGIGGSGSANYVPRWTAATTQGNSHFLSV